MQACQAFNHCVATLKSKNKDYFMCCMFSDYRFTQYFIPLYLFHVEVSSAFYGNKEQTFLTKLTWWKWQFDTIYENPNSIYILKDPLSISLSIMVKKTNLPHSLIIEYLDGYERFAYRSENFTLSNLEEFAKNTYGVFLNILLFISGTNCNDSNINRHAGIAWGFATAIRNHGLNENSYIPNDVAIMFDLKNKMLSKKDHELSTLEALNFIADRALIHADIAALALKDFPETYNYILPNLMTSMFHLQKIKKYRKPSRQANTALYLKIATASCLRSMKIRLSSLLKKDIQP